MSTANLDFAINLPFLDDLYAQYRQDPASVDASWRKFFEANGENGTASKAAPSLAHQALSRTVLATSELTLGVYGLVQVFRERGHFEANLDPLEHFPRHPVAELLPAAWGFSSADGVKILPTGGLWGTQTLSLADLIERLKTTYCRSIGVEFMHITDAVRRQWLIERMEGSLNQPAFEKAERLRILDRLVAAETIENFVHTKYVGTKRFSLEGAESLIPLLDCAVEQAADEGVEDIVLGMAHRGRLNVLTNILHKTPRDLFAEFEDIDPKSMFGGGDVKYHLGFSSDHVTDQGKRAHLSMTFNPSHLEAVDPVVLGRVRAKQRRKDDTARNRVLGILVHGDAAFAGQGLVFESLNLAELHGYRTGGTLHIIVNNQIGFTTVPAASRSTYYCTDIAKSLSVPIFHVNGDDPDAVRYVTKLAMDYRREFKADVVIDMFCYRRYGHNEADEPSFTQPLMYQKIQAQTTTQKLYGQKLISEGVLTVDEVEAVVAKHHNLLDEAFRAARPETRPAVHSMGGYWAGYSCELDTSVPDVDSGVERGRLERVAASLTTIPEGFSAHPKVAKLLSHRAEMGKGERPLDWGMGEHLAFGTLVDEGVRIRVSGQDSRRGTFSQRHAVLVDQRTEGEYVPLEHVRPGQAIFRIYDSPLSEAGVLGFEFGYSLDYPDALVVWEAQFGDFINGAQVIIDQFITSAEDKWKRLSGLVLLLPHGFEGQGPEHSSARFERFLKLCAEDNIQVCYPTTPAQYFHMLRRQVVRKWRKPLVVMTPKSLLRLPAAASTLNELTCGRFLRLIPDGEIVRPEEVKRVVFCTGKVFYDLQAERKKRGDFSVAFIRVEQLYPLRTEQLVEALSPFGRVREILWLQEEPVNMGAAFFMAVRLERIKAERQLKVVARTESASPATGSYKAHVLEQEHLVGKAFAPIEELE